MNSILRCVALATSVVAALSCSPYVLAKDANASRIQQRFEQLFPDVKVQSVQPTPVTGIYELVIVQDGQEIVYTDNKVNYLFSGDLIDLKTRQSLTEEHMRELTRVDVSKLPLNNALKSVRSNGQRQLIVFSDPDCPYCKQLEKELIKLDDVTIYTFLYPLAGLHPNAEHKARQIWCSKDQVGAWNNLMRDGKALTGTDDCANPIAANIKLGAKLGFSGTPTLVFPDGSVVPGALDVERINAKLDGKK